MLFSHLSSGLLCCILAHSEGSAARRTQGTTNLTTLAVGSFGQTPILALAQSQGFFAAQGLNVTSEVTKSSAEIYQKLQNGTWPLIVATADNNFNYRLNPSNPNGAAGVFDPTIIGLVDYGADNILAGAKNVTSAAAVKGQTVIVDSSNSGLAFILYAVLKQKANLTRNVDYDVKIPVASGTAFRLADLVNGSSIAYNTSNSNKGPTRAIVPAASVLNSPFTFEGLAQGLNTLGAVADVAPQYAGVALTVRAQWLRTNQATAVRFLKAWLQATDWALSPANKPTVIRYLITTVNKNISNTTAVAEQIYASLQLSNRNLTISDAKLLGTAQLRQQFQGFDNSTVDLTALCSNASGLYDMGPLKLAQTQLL